MSRATQDAPPPEDDFARHLRSALNPAQLRAVTSPDGPHRVVAGAGTGKTRTLIYRVAHLIHRGERPESILLLTFTRRASREMLRRASTLLDARCRRVSGGTFHSFANLVLRRYAERIGFHNRFTILDRGDAIDLMGILRSEAGYDRGAKRFPKASSLIDLFSRQVNTQRPLRELIEAEMPQFAEYLDQIQDLEGRWRRRKQEQNVMDYDDLLLYLRDLLSKHPEVRGALGKRYRHVLVDEYQDTNRLQAHITALLGSVHQNLMVVGDDAQSIYGFRGASFRNILDFPKLFPDARDTVLEQNYRSVQPILDLGNAVLESATKKITKRLFTDIEGDDKPVLVRATDDYAQAQLVCEQVLELREQGVSLADMAVLVRAGWHTSTLELELQNHNIPFRKFGGQRFTEAAHIKDLFAVLKLGANPYDTTAWFRVLQFFDGIGPKTARSITGHVLERGGDPKVLVQPKLTSKKYGKDLKVLADLLATVGDASTSLGSRLETAIQQMERWLPARYDDAALRAKDFEAIAVIAARYDDLERLLAELAIDPPEFSRGRAAEDDEDEMLTLSTVHSAKGLEWHTVFVLHMNAGRFPTFAAFRSDDDLDEERRLFYVAITRARQRLFLIKPEEMATRGNSYEVGELSPLLGDLEALGRLVEERVYAPGADDAWSEPGDELDAGDGEQLQRIEDYFSS